MMNKVVKFMKRVVSITLAITMGVAGSFMVRTDVKAATGEADEVYNVGGVRYVEYDTYTVGEAPLYSGVNDDYGYLFGGWYTREEVADGKYEYNYVLKDDEVSGNLYAKFVPAYVLSIKCQNILGGTEKGADMRIVSSIDSRNYKGVGFDLIQITKNADGTFAEQVTLGTNNGQKTYDTYNNFKVYSDADKSKSYNAETIFGEGAKYLTTWRVDDITDSTSIIGIRPYWITPDDVQVYGLVKYAHTEDGFEGYINVPVNLNNATDVAAGVLSVSYPSGLKLVDVERGQVFQEMEYADKGVSDATGTVKCVGNIEAITKNADSDNMYINMRFEVTGGLTDGVNSYQFVVNGEDFADIDENQFTSDTYDVWNVKAAVLN